MKKLVAPFFYPLPLCVEILLAGLILLWWPPRERMGRWVITMGVVLLVVLGEGTVAGCLLRPLELAYPPLDPASVPREVASSIRWVVVLGGGQRVDPRVPISSHLNEPSLERLLEGIRLHRAFPGSTLVLSGGSGGAASAPVAEAMAQVAELLGMNRGALLLESTSSNTEEQARWLQPIVGKDPFVLVTSASHMPRAIALFEKRRMDPLPAPTDYHIRITERPSIHPGSFFPSASSLHAATVAVHEYLGLAWVAIR